MASKTELIRTTTLLIEKARRQLQQFSKVQAQASPPGHVQANNKPKSKPKATHTLRNKSRQGTLSDKCGMKICSSKPTHTVSVGIETNSGKGLKIVLRSGGEHAPDGSHNQAPATAAAPPAEARLTPRQLRVLLLIINGFTNRDIALKLDCSIKTVEKHRQQVYAKLGAHEAAGLARRALEFGIVRAMPHGWREIARRAKLLTQRELEVLKLVAQGAGNKWIAAEWGRSMKTIDHHREHIMAKLGVHDVPGLTQCAVALGLLSEFESH